MEGSVRKIGENWFYCFDVGKVDGKRKRIERKGGKTKKEALIALREAIREFEKCGTVIEESNLSVSDYFDYWYKEYALINCKYNTQISYKRIIANHIKPILGIYKLKAITPGVLQEFLNKKYVSGFSKNTLTGFYGVLSGAFKAAVYPYQLIKENPMTYVHMPKIQNTKKDKEDLKIISIADYKRIIERFPEGSNFYIPIQISFYTGLRASEVCGMTWDCIDLESRKITVDKIINKETIWCFGTPKTESSERTIEMGNALTEILKRHKEYQEKNKLKYGVHYANETYIYKERNRTYTNNDLVSTRENGELISTESLKYLSRIVNYELGIKFSFHSFRHTHATMFLESDSDYKDIQFRLGHSKLSTTMDTYSHVTRKMRQSSIDKFESHLSDILE